nr:mesothelin-like protein isoform X1 [Oryctolagus cuniculus]
MSQPGPAHRTPMGTRAGALACLGLALLLCLAAHCSPPWAKSVPQGEPDAGGDSLGAGANASVLQGFCGQPACQLPRDQLSALIRSLASQQVPLKAWQLSCLANLAARHRLQDDFLLHPPDLLLFYNLSQVRVTDCRAFTGHAAQGHTELLANLPDQRAALQHMALACLGGPPPRLSAADLELLGALVCDMDAASILAADPRVLQNLRRCPQLTTAQGAALNGLLASGRTYLGWVGSLVATAPRPQPHSAPAAVGHGDGGGGWAPQHGCQWPVLLPRPLGGACDAALDPDTAPIPRPRPPETWNLEGLRALGPLALHISPCLWAQVPKAVGLGFFRSVVAASRAGRLSQREARRFATSFLQSRATSGLARPRRGTGRPCVPGNLTAAALRDDLLLVRYNCAQLQSCLDGQVLRAGLDALLQQPLPAECQHVVKAKLAQIYPGGVPEDQLPRITSLVYLYSLAEISQWNITSRDTVQTLLAPDVALENQTEAVLQKFLDHNGTVTGALLVAIGGCRLCRMSARQIQAIGPAEFRLAGALDVSCCAQNQKNALFAKAREAFGSTRTAAAYYHFIRPYLGGAPVEELQRLAQANVSMDIDTFASLNPSVLQSLSVSSVATLLGQNLGDLQKARSHPAIRSWLRGLNTSALSQLGLHADPTGPAAPAAPTQGRPHTSALAPRPAHFSGRPDSAAAPASGSPPARPCPLLAAALPCGLLWLLLSAPPSEGAGSRGRAPRPHTQGRRGLWLRWVPRTPISRGPRGPEPMQPGGGGGRAVG